ncbi:hypothetical protein [Streptomyces sp. NPDC020298]|uniref:hypothetical protein n=1 Tax=unclassified Streptomyces TaxID=2593676 RepID=UPI0033E60794
MSISPLALQAKKVIEAAWLHGPSYDLASQAAFALESAQLLQSPELVTEVSEAAVATAAQAVDELKREHAENERLRARIAELEAERHSTNEALDDAVQELRTRRDDRSVERSADKLTRMLAPTQALREVLDGEHYAATHHTYRTGRDLPPLDGAR